MTQVQAPGVHFTGVFFISRTRSEYVIKYGEVMGNTGRQHKQMPHAVKVLDAIVVNKKDHTKGVQQAANQEE